ncbi:MAG: HD domain-containing protein [Parcubacteria group bacterium]|jgi:HD superfamily phosphodiesterase
MNEKIQKFKKHVIELSRNPDFVHHKWFVKYHLEIVEKIAMELCNIYKAADRDLVLTAVWLHDYGKLINFEKRHETTQTEGRKKLLEIGFAEDFIRKALELVGLMDKSMDIDLSTASLETKIVSSADGASHFVGPFYLLWWNEQPQIEPEELLEDDIRKANKDWNRKIVLPEVKKSFQARYDHFLEERGKFPEKYLNNRP